MIESSLYETMKNIGVNEEITYHLSDIYAWTIDFFRLQKGDRFKIIYTEKFVDDSISIGVDRIKAAYFEHKGNPLYAFEFISNPRNIGTVAALDIELPGERALFKLSQQGFDHHLIIRPLGNTIYLYLPLIMDDLHDGK